MKNVFDALQVRFLLPTFWSCTVCIQLGNAECNDNGQLWQEKWRNNSDDDSMRSPKPSSSTAPNPVKSRNFGIDASSRKCRTCIASQPIQERAGNRSGVIAKKSKRRFFSADIATFTSKAWAESGERRDSDALRRTEWREQQLAPRSKKKKTGRTIFCPAHKQEELGTHAMPRGSSPAIPPQERKAD